MFASAQPLLLNYTNKKTTDPAFDLTATASSGLVVSYASSNTAVATISDSIVTKEVQLEQPEFKNLPVIAYPNPVRDVLHINLNRQSASAEAQIFDIFGRLLLNQKLTDSDTELKVSLLPVGLYLVKVFADNKEISVIKIVKM